MRISDWISDVCSSDLAGAGAGRVRVVDREALLLDRVHEVDRRTLEVRRAHPVGDHADATEVGHHVTVELTLAEEQARKSVGEGRSVSVSDEFGGRRYIQKKTSSR